MRFRAAALLATLALVSVCDGCLNSFAVIGTAVLAIVSGGDVGGGGRDGDMEEMNAYTTISLKKSDGGNDRKEKIWQRGGGEELTRWMMTTKMTTTTTTKTTTTMQQSNSAREREGLMMTVAIGSWGLAMLTTIDGDGDCCKPSDQPRDTA